MTLKKRSETNRIVIHCSATPAKMDIGVTEIDRWHRERGWIGIGYHLVIRRDGTIEVGRDHDVPGAHAKDYNDDSISICMVGGLTPDGKPEDNFTPEQNDSLKYLVRLLKDTYPNAEVLGHRDLPGVAKDCPCFDVKTKLKKIL